MTDPLVASITLALWAAYAIVDRRRPWPATTLGFWAAWYASLAVINMVGAEHPITMCANAGFSAWCAYHAWKRRKPRQRKPSKAAGRVRDIGHRLVVSST